MEFSRLAELLAPFLPGAEPSPQLLSQLDAYLDLLLRWNARVNLTAVRDPEQIVTRHFGESLFAGEVLQRNADFRRDGTLADVGSGAGFPGIPIKLLVPGLELTLIESQNKKATFLREIVRALELPRVNVFHGRAEQWDGSADTVTLRAVERFERALPVAAGLVREGGLLCLLIGEEQLSLARRLLGGEWNWPQAIALPQSSARRIVIAQRAAGIGAELRSGARGGASDGFKANYSHGRRRFRQRN
jgi:16S rRNA (guanine527-N7)-methyltransferase